MEPLDGAKWNQVPVWARVWLSVLFMSRTRIPQERKPRKDIQLHLKPAPICGKCGTQAVTQSCRKRRRCRRFTRLVSVAYTPHGLPAPASACSLLYDPAPSFYPSSISSAFHLQFPSSFYASAVCPTTHNGTQSAVSWKRNSRNPRNPRNPVHFGFHVIVICLLCPLMPFHRPLGPLLWPFSCHFFYSTFYFLASHCR